MSITNNSDKAGESYWTSFWKSGNTLPASIELEGKRTSTYLARQLDHFYSALFKGKDNSQKRLLEVGCGNSVWLSYFRKYYGFQVYGLDYSEYGCEQTIKILQRDGLDGVIKLGDLFNPPPELLGTFDVVCSFGVVEHFTDTAAVLSAIKRFLKPDGILITTVPNLNGATGVLQKLFYKPVYDIHVVMDIDFLASSLQTAGMEVLHKQYYCTTTFGVTLEPINSIPIRALFLKKIVLKLFQSFGKVLIYFDDVFFSLPKRKYTTEAIFTVARIANKNQ
jgi:SAM-dependent methyltransferase